ncbi:RNA-binding domain-containing protein [Ophiobolus disseminans]|uniref:RNA-binding domain-containing protein n=1 Tax=Ophiobolus disseminans TaxID=1469910 RepID=A0A6A7AH66_9PLEO|nr:RNA-binding domain-containing protein [Ophiobolus disseminans]
MATSTRGAPGTVAVASKEGIPNRTLYVRGLPDKLPKEDLKRNLYMLFATYGVLLDVVALKTMKMRGQAHIVFRDLDASTQAMRALHNTMFLGKYMQIAYAKTKSDTIAKLDGSYKMPEVEREGGSEEADAPTTAFGSVPEKAVPVNAADVAKGQKRGRDEEEEEEEASGSEMDVSDDSD